MSLDGTLQQLAVLVDPTRVRLLSLLQDHELTVVDLCSILELPQSTVSRHLKVLLDNGWLSKRKAGARNFYEVAVSWPDEVGRQVWDLIDSKFTDLPQIRLDQARLVRVLKAREEASRGFFADTGEAWDRVRGELFGERFDIMGLLAFLDSSWTVGDLGCGTGRISRMLAPFVANVVAVDREPVMLEAARYNTLDLDNVRVLKGELGALPIKDGTLDAATLFLVLNYVPEPALVIKEAARVLKPGGRLVVIDMEHHEDEALAERMGHVWMGFDRDRIRSYIGGAGFEGLVVHTLPTEGASANRLFVASAALGNPNGHVSAGPDV